MKQIFNETFESRLNGNPGGWSVEFNSDLTQSGIVCEKNFISLLSAGNKFIPVIPDISDFELKMRASVNFTMADSHFALILSFRYDIASRRGFAVRIGRRCNEPKTYIEYGEMSANNFTALKTAVTDIPDDDFEKPFDCVIKLAGEKLEVIINSRETIFSGITLGKGKIALSREHFFDVMKILSFDIFSDDEYHAKAEKNIRVPLPSEPTHYPIFCDVTLRDLGNCMDAELTFSGGVPDTPAGEGNYHVMRAQFLDKPFLKVIKPDSISKYTCRENRILLINEELAPKYFWKIMHPDEKIKWPFTCTVRFIKPFGKFDLAVGCECFTDSTIPGMSQKPSETIFDLKGKILYSGLGITEAPRKIEFLSQPNKQIISKLPKKDPRRKRAVEFAKNNHYFFDGEKIDFSIRITSAFSLPLNFKVELENAFMSTVKQLKFTKTYSTQSIGVSRFNSVLLKISSMPHLKPGVWHIRVSNLDPSILAFSDYCAFEVMSKEKNSAPPPLLSGIPYLYNSRTETRGLIADAFDPWTGSSVDDGHYISCANFLPRAARDFHIAPTVHVYGREWFLWSEMRCSDKPLAKDNLDLIAEADYINICEEVGRFQLLWGYKYTGWLLRKFIEFAKIINDPEISASAIEKLADENPDTAILPITILVAAARKYWEEWLDFINREFSEREKTILNELRKVNPKLKYSQYGPAHIYAARLKGPEFIRYLLAANVSTDILGFWQYEDYPFACSYGLERGTYFLTSCLMSMPGHLICPEIYANVASTQQGCPDGAVFFAHPPFGARYTDVPIRMIRRVYDYALASAYFDADGFHFWEKCGFQTCKFNRSWYEALLYAWRTVHDYPPARPLRSSAFVSSNESRRAHPTMVSGMGSIEKSTIIDVRNTASEVVPFAYQTARVNQICAGFQLMMENIEKLDPKQVDAIVIPPLKGVSKKYIEAIRKLHEKGVSLIGFEDVSCLEDIFGVKNTEKFVSVKKLRACGDFLNGETECCVQKLCAGKYAADGAKILINAETPVLMLKDNGKAKAAFFNVPPHIVREDELNERLSYGKESISRLMNRAMAEIMKLLSDADAKTTDGRIIAYHSKNAAEVIVVTNPDGNNAINPVVTLRKSKAKSCIVKCDKPYAVLSDSSKMIQFRFRLGPEESAVVVLK